MPPTSQPTSHVELIANANTPSPTSQATMPSVESHLGAIDVDDESEDLAAQKVDDVSTTQSVDSQSARSTDSSDSFFFDNPWSFMLIGGLCSFFCMFCVLFAIRALRKATHQTDDTPRDERKPVEQHGVETTETVSGHSGEPGSSGTRSIEIAVDDIDDYDDAFAPGSPRDDVDDAVLLDIDTEYLHETVGGSVETDEIIVGMDTDGQ